MSVDLEAGGDREGDHRDQLGGVAADDRAAEHHAGGRVGEDLHEARGVVVDQRLGVGRERHLGHPDLAARGERLGLGQADVGDLGLGEDGRRRLVVVEVAVRRGCAGPSRARRSCGPASPPPTTAAACPTRRRPRRCAATLRLAVVVDRDVAAGVDLDAGGVEPEVLGVGDRADGEQRRASRRRTRPSSQRTTHAVAVARRCALARAPFSSATPRRGSRPRAPRPPRGPSSAAPAGGDTMSVTFDAERREHVRRTRRR